VKARITVYPRPEILDPQGRAIREALARNGFDTVLDLRAGKSFDLELSSADSVAARDELEAICSKVLANPLMESYAVEILPEVGVP
jgi:phosphoribosylformylglycinamidine synthase subunit PurS